MKAIPEQKKLTPKQKKFCDYYLISGNATDAAAKSGYSKKTAVEIGSQNLTKLNIKEYIASKQVKLQEKLDITQERVLCELVKIGFGNIQDMMKEGFTFTDIVKMEKDKAAAIESVSVRTITRKVGNINVTDKDVKVKTYNKIDALEKLGKHLGIFKADNDQKKTEVKINLSNLSNEEVEALSKMIEKTSTQNQT